MFDEAEAVVRVAVGVDPAVILLSAVLLSVVLLGVVLLGVVLLKVVLLGVINGPMLVKVVSKTLMMV